MCVASLFLTSLLIEAATPPNITAHEAHLKAEEIFRAHARHKELTSEISKRIIISYLDELDPIKCYLTKQDLSPYLDPSNELLKKIESDYKKEEFSVFQSLYDLFLEAIERRNLIEEKIEALPLPKEVTAKELHEADWPANSDDLESKLLKIRALQNDSAEKLATPEQSTIFFQRVAKRRYLREKEFTGASKLDQKRQMLSCFLKALASSLDSHTMYFTPQEAKQFLIQVQQRLFGIGAQLRDDLNGFTVVQIVEGGPASHSNELKIGDKIIAVNHEPIAGMDITEAVDLIRGPEGSAVILTIVREHPSQKEEKFDIVIIREEIVLTESRFSSKVEPYGSGAIGYLSLHSFYQDPKHSSYIDLKKSIDEMKACHNVKGIILDLRHNSGGLLPQAVEVTGLFIDKGVVASIKDHTGHVQRLRNLNEEVSWSGPLIILINRASASASEIVALALADYGRALIVGDEATYGKGTYQTFTLESSNPEKINPQGEYKVTRGAYYTVGGRTPQLTGVKSDLEVPGILSNMEIGEKYAKYPLENDKISPLFEDDLSDVHPLYRTRLKKALGKSIQKPSNKLDTYIADLKAHSQKRIEKNANYQNFLKEIRAIDRYEIDFNLTGQNDLQLEEAFNIMKELILLSKNGS
ncbi:MAG: PDZ domain-containing protein [Chlamydiae bacterium]|nr:PDZ domain-containing protein [Chlamydiota bacterium]